jgi:hypothetical protein
MTLLTECDRTRPRASGRLRHTRFGLALLCASTSTAATLTAQRPDSTRVAARPLTPPPDSVRPPLSPRRAFFYSALIPGYSQSVFGRHKAAALMLLVEALSLTMIRESAADVREARRMSGDTVIVSYVNGTTGAADTTKSVRRFDDQFVHTRESHVEDWVAFLVANHLFSAADAFVAANLWDIPAQLSVRLTPNGAVVGASIAW